MINQMNDSGRFDLLNNFIQDSEIIKMDSFLIADLTKFLINKRVKSEDFECFLILIYY